MSVSAVIVTQLFCVHGGFSPSISTLDEIQNIPKESRLSGVTSDLLWSDPGECNGWAEGPREADFFGPDVAAQFNHNNFRLIYRKSSTCYEWVLLEQQ